MADSLKKFQKTFEIFANEQAAEIEAVRAVLQCFVVQILNNHPQGPKLFVSLRDETLKRLDTETKHPDNDQDAKRKAEFVHLRASQIFDEMAPVFGFDPAGSSEPRN